MFVFEKFAEFEMEEEREQKERGREGGRERDSETERACYGWPWPECG